MATFKEIGEIYSEVADAMRERDRRLLPSEKKALQYVMQSTMKGMKLFKNVTLLTSIAAVCFIFADAYVLAAVCGVFALISLAMQYAESKQFAACYNRLNKDLDQEFDEMRSKFEKEFNYERPDTSPKA